MPVSAYWNEHQVAVTARDLLKDFLHGYLGLVERRYPQYFTSEHLPVPPEKAFIAASQENTGTPALGDTRIYVICPGLADSPEETGEQGYDAAYSLIVGVEIHKRNGREAVNAQLSMYMEAIKECILREGSQVFGVPGVVIDWEDERTDEGSAAAVLTSGQGQVGFAIYLPDVVADTASLFPDGPPIDPYEPLPDEPVIVDVTIDVNNYPVDEELPE